MRKIPGIALGLVLIFFISIPTFSQSKKAIKLHEQIVEKLAAWQNPFTKWNYLGKIELDTFSIDIKKKIITFQFSTPLSYIPVREEIYQQAISGLQNCLGEEFQKYTCQITADGQTLEALIPNFYRINTTLDMERNERSVGHRIPLVRKPENENTSLGLHNRNIALWHSHGRYYEPSLDRWEWQRARLFTTVEDIFPMTFVLPYLTPMLENAGANVFLPRERDIQTNEIIVDNDLSTKDSEILFHKIVPRDIPTKGFLKKDTLYNLQNPFLLGSYLQFSSSEEEDQYMDYLPYFSEEGDYAVYVSYAQSNENISDAQYTVIHTGGETTFLINQKMGGSTWIYLGTFHFKKGKDLSAGSVRLSAKSINSGTITADAVRFGGGMGNIARNPKVENSEILIRPKTSEKARYVEGARYYLQYAGAPASLVYNLNEEKNDYNDDYQSRGEWVNYLMGSPNGPNGNRIASGLNIPIDLALAFHTDAGVTSNDSTIGTLAIYSSVKDAGKFPNDRSKMINRDLSDIIQSEIVHDIRLQFYPEWTRRGLWNKEYSEAWRPNTPTMLLELLSHQNLIDMRLGHDPVFKFAVSRAIYKGIVKFLAFYSNSKYVIQPLPVDHFAIEKTGDKSIKLSWQAVLDSMEPTAVPQKYKVYRRIGSGGFDNGQVVEGNIFRNGD